MLLRLDTGVYRTERRSIVHDDGTERSLTPVEARLLEYLALHPGQVLSIGRLLCDVWQWSARTQSRTPYVTINRLRSKIEVDPSNPRHLRAVAGGGYVFEARVVDAPLPADVPQDRDSFMGRAQELALLDEHLEAGARLITLCGQGGAGKTRLAREWARRATRVCWCDLTECHDETGVITAAAAALDVPPLREGAAAIGRKLAAAGAIRVVLDNAEQVHAPVRALVDAWLQAAPGAAFLVTSRIALGVRGEVTFPVDPLPVPGGDEESVAVDLFVSRARAADARFRPGSGDAAAIAAVVRATEGLPLAIEIAAARVPLLGLDGVRAALVSGVDLHSATSDHPRHRSLGGAIAWSWDLLSPNERRDLAALSVCASGFDLGAAGAVLECAEDAAVRRVSTLLSWNLLSVRMSAAGAACTLPVGVRAFVSARLAPAERTAAEARHGAWYAASTEASVGEVWNTAHPSHIANLSRARDNLSLALDRGVSRGDGLVAARCLAALWALTFRTGPFAPMVERASAVLAMPGLEPAERAAALEVRGHAAWQSGAAVAGGADLEESVRTSRTSGDARALCSRLARLAANLHERRDRVRAREALAEARELARQTHFVEIESWLLSLHGVWLVESGDFREGADVLDRALDATRRAGERQREATVLVQLAIARSALGDLAGLVRACQGAVDLARRDANRRAEGIALNNLSVTAFRAGDAERSAALAMEAAVVNLEAGNRRSEATSLCNAALALARSGRPAEGVELAHRAVVMFEATSEARGVAAGFAYLAEALLADRQPGEAQASLRRGPAPETVPEVPALRLAHARVALAAGRIDEADAHLAEAAGRDLAPVEAFILHCTRALSLRTRGEPPAAALAAAAALVPAPFDGPGSWQRAMLRQLEEARED